jgi:translation initiation factor 2 beta subunit (eIF-2beta)/eIF-5
MKIPFPKNEKTLIDPSYRYKRDIIVIDKSGQFSILKNIVSITKDLNIKLEDLIKYLQKKLSQTIILDKTTNIYKMKNINVTDIEKFLEQYIVENMVCTKCQLPEVKDKICKACGNCN